jgi:hypothetical protein
MEFLWVREFFDIKTLISAVIGGLIVYFRNGLKTITYTVNHQGVAFSSNDPIFGSIQVMWHQSNVVNLYISTIEITNNTNRDFKDISFKVYSNDTDLLSERTEIKGTAQIIEWSIPFKQLLAVQSGNVPTKQQLDIYSKRREYILPVFNRGQKAVLTFLTSDPSGVSGPAVWVDMQHQGARVLYQSSGPQIHGVPQKIALILGLIVSFAVLGACIFFSISIWFSSLICLIVGLISQSLGALVYRVYRSLKLMILG